MILLVLTLIDGSTLNMQVKADYQLEFKSPYYTAKFKVSDVTDADVGAHVDDEKLYLSKIDDLGGGEHRDREAATKFFKAHAYGGYRYLLAAKAGKNFEASQRASSLLKEYAAIPPQQDIVTLSDQKLTGQFVTTGIPCHSDHLGDVTVLMSSIKSFYCKPAITTTKLPYGEWKTVAVARGRRVKITATGSINLWPQTPGQYISGPDGISTMKDSYQGGAIIGRLGSRTFLVGSSFSANLDEGKLELRINPSPWGGNVVEGEYEVTIEQ